MLCSPFLQDWAVLKYPGRKLAQTEGGKVGIVFADKVFKVPLRFFDLEVDSLWKVSMLSVASMDGVGTSTWRDHKVSCKLKERFTRTYRRQLLDWQIDYKPGKNYIEL